MLTSIEQDGQILNLRTKNSYNLFDIDSLSLLIGPNGAGKSRFLKTLVEKFSLRQHPSFDAECRLSFDYFPTFEQHSLSDWGLVYYTPVRNQPSFRRQTNFINASRPQK